MKRHLLLLSAAVMLCLTAAGKQISASQALSVARKYADIKQSEQVETLKKSPQSDNAYYAFNKKSGGFIIIAGDDRMTELVGYSDQGSFEMERIPDNMRNWLEAYTHYVGLVREGKAAPQKKNLSANPKVSVTPLLTTNWGQDAPYNLLAPVFKQNGDTYHCPAGCVATAMAQVMNYHKWPERGTGKHSYSHSFGSSSVDFSQSVYKWEQMLDSYNYDGNFSEEQANAVARLMYDCAVSVNMNWGRYESGAQSTAVEKAMDEHFGYDSRLYFRDNMTSANFSRMLTDEIDNLRPIYFFGSGPGGGHAFVIDGYDSNGLFHVNWGWNGGFNGYFNISDMNPDGLGTGGGAGSYNWLQGIVTAIPLRNGETPDSSVKLSYYDNGDSDVGLTVSPDTGSTASGISVYVKNLSNDSHTDFIGDVAVAIFGPEGDMKATSSPRQFKAGRFPAWQYLNGFSLTIPATPLPDGNYQIRTIYRAEGETEWTAVTTKFEAEMTVAGGQYAISTIAVGPLSLSEAASFSDNPQIGREATLCLRIHNDGKRTADGTLSLGIYEENGDSPIVNASVDDIIPDGSDKNITWKFTLDADKFAAGKLYEVKLSRFWTRSEELAVGNPFGKIQFSPTDYVPAAQLRISLNSGTPYYGSIYLNNNDFPASQGADFAISELKNYNTTDFSGRIGYMITDSKGTEITAQPVYDIALPAGEGCGGWIMAGITDFERLQPGIYRLYPVTWQEIDGIVQPEATPLATDPYIAFEMLDDGWVKVLPCEVSLKSFRLLNTPSIGGKAEFETTWKNKSQLRYIGEAYFQIIEPGIGLKNVVTIPHPEFWLDSESETSITLTLPLDESYETGKDYLISFDACYPNPHTVPFSFSNEAGTAMFQVSGSSVDSPETRNGLRLWPVPTNHELNVESSSSLSAVAVYTASGIKTIRKTFPDKTEKATIDVSALQKGYYIAVISTADGEIKRPFVKR